MVVCWRVLYTIVDFDAHYIQTIAMTESIKPLGWDKTASPTYDESGELKKHLAYTSVLAATVVSKRLRLIRGR